MEILSGKFKTGRSDSNFLFSGKIECQVREFTPIHIGGKISGVKRRAFREQGVSLFKLNRNVFHKPRKPEAKPKEIKKQPLIGNKLRDLFRFKNLRDTAIAFNTSEANLNNLNSGKAGDGLSNAYRCVIAFAGEIPVRRRKKILANINFDQTFSNT